MRMSLETSLTVLSVVGSVVAVVVLVATGWYIMWKLFLSKFQFIREILSGSEIEDQRQRKKKLRKE